MAAKANTATHVRLANLSKIGLVFNVSGIDARAQNNVQTGSASRICTGILHSYRNASTGLNPAARFAG